MAGMPEIKVKVVPDFSDWDKEMAKKFPEGIAEVQIPVDDPLALAIQIHGGLNIVAYVGTAKYDLYNWVLTTNDGKTTMRTQWR